MRVEDRNRVSVKGVDEVWELKGGEHKYDVTMPPSRYNSFIVGASLRHVLLLKPCMLYGIPWWFRVIFPILSC